uniref:Gamma-interferon-inducible lysosomal thiol reductase n=1 Tax=Oryza meridionalis TaxID=40149 RepID=A0A0E0C9Q9_9ORYZ
MACCSCSSSSRILPRILVLSLVLLSLATAPCAAGRVTVSVYYETLCPFCSGFVVNDIARIFRDGLSPVVDLRLVPFGNGRVSPDGSITCQHGEEECQLNAIEACVIRLWPDAEQHFPFINCIEHLALTQKWNAWQSCFQETGLASQPVMDCYNSGYGTQLQLQYAAETNALQPPHQFVPWVTVNGRPLGDDYTNFEAYICRAYDGELPEACRGKHLAIAQQTRASRGGKRNPHKLAVLLAFCIAVWF